jgi:hypothetical protein
VPRFRIYVSRDQALRCLPGECVDAEEAKRLFEKHHGEVAWCLIGHVDEYTDRPTFMFHGMAGRRGVEWRALGPQPGESPEDRL